MSQIKFLAEKLPKPLKDSLRKLLGRTPLLIPRRKLGGFAFSQHVRAVFRQREIECVIDVGGNVGKFGRFLRQEIGFQGRIISLEPVRSNFEQLQKAAAGDSQWTVYQTAVGRAPGKLSINVMESDDFSSFLTPKEANVFETLMHVSRKEEVPIIRLDDFIRQSEVVLERAFLKIDTQGYELEVLEGAGDELSKIEGVQIELAFVVTYEGMPDYSEVLRELRGLGFVISGMYPVSLTTELSAVEADCLLVRDRPVKPGDHRPYDSIVIGFDPMLRR